MILSGGDVVKGFPFIGAATGNCDREESIQL